MGNTKEVYFDLYCSKCLFKDKKGYEDPCNNCIEHGYNVDSHKPVEFKPAK